MKSEYYIADEMPSKYIKKTCKPLTFYLSLQITTKALSLLASEYTLKDNANVLINVSLNKHYRV